MLEGQKTQTVSQMTKQIAGLGFLKAERKTRKSSDRTGQLLETGQISDKDLHDTIKYHTFDVLDRIMNI